MNTAMRRSAEQSRLSITRLEVALALLVISGAAGADDSAMRRCRAIADPAARLACYDALGSPSSAAEQFGRETQRVAPAALESIESHVPGMFQGWQPQSLIRLANGQLWQVADGSTGSYRLVDPKVKLQRGLLGSYFLELEGQNRSIRVKRVE